MKKTRFLSAFLALLMLVGPLASCATGDLPDDTKAEQTAAATEEGTGITDDLPALDYNDQEVTIISRDMEGWTRGEVSVDGVKGDPVNDARSSSAIRLSSSV